MDYKQVFELADERGYKSLWEFTDVPLPTSKLDTVKYMELCLIQKWLRDKHKIFVTVQRASYGHYGEVIYKDITKDSDPIHSALSMSTMTYSYEQALLDGVTEALKLLPVLKPADPEPRMNYWGASEADILKYQEDLDAWRARQKGGTS